eukprot:CAMPEP_0184494672 /NCGR_PEP_ID=MMETSP0113_2-20130426/29311_1 /TAXON_ID=91329 /ORGANISM="Norrisiella sphaerica, Strain BC52" /LENGTH=697 /DNA_ID=CAMNT_0026880527 /DNA_START=181 /DNA_END=2274 /DNA_ORIENTATION=-
MGLCASEVINPNEVDISHFQIMTTIGAGGFGKVRLAVDVKEQRINPNNYVALKFLDVSYYHKPHRRQQLRREREALITIKSPFVVQIMHAFTTTYEIIFVMPFLRGGDFCVYLSRKSISEEQVRHAAGEIILGLEAIHAQSYVYRDLKPENILLDGDGHCVITDLGLVAKISDFDSKYNEPFSKRWDPPHHCRLRGVSGTPGYMAPEVFVKSYDQLADFFALGALIYSFFTNKVPFPNQSRKYFFKTSFILPDGVNRLSKHAKSLVKGLCAYYEKDRLGYDNFWDDVKDHPFFDVPGFSWDRLQTRKMKSPFKITEDFNFDIRYNLEDTFALNYGTDNTEKISKEEAQKILSHLKGITYNIDPPFKLSDGSIYSTGATGSPAALPNVKNPSEAIAQDKGRENANVDSKDKKDVANWRKPKITHLSKIINSVETSKMSSHRTMNQDSKRMSPAPSSNLTPRNSILTKSAKKVPVPQSLRKSGNFTNTAGANILDPAHVILLSKGNKEGGLIKNQGKVTENKFGINKDTQQKATSEQKQNPGITDLNFIKEVDNEGAKESKALRKTEKEGELKAEGKIEVKKEEKEEKKVELEEKVDIVESEREEKEETKKEELAELKKEGPKIEKEELHKEDKGVSNQEKKMFDPESLIDDAKNKALKESEDATKNAECEPADTEQKVKPPLETKEKDSDLPVNTQDP